MRKLLMVLALSLPLMAQQVEVKEVDGNTTVKVDGKEVKGGKVKIVRQHDQGDMRAWKQRGDGRKMEQRKKRSHMRKKRAIRSAVRILVVGGVAYYIGYHKGQHNKHPMKRKPYMGDRK